MSELPQVTGARLLRALERAGFRSVRQVGSHVFIQHVKDKARCAVIPVHGSRVIKPGTLRAILQGVRLSVEELRDLL